MAEFSPKERIIKLILCPIALGGWWYFAPDYSNLFSTPFGQLTLGYIAHGIGWLVGLLPILYATVSWVYEACTGRDSVWFWHPN